MNRTCGQPMLGLGRLMCGRPCPLLLLGVLLFADQPFPGQPLCGLGRCWAAAPVPYLFQGFCCFLSSPCLGSPYMGQVTDVWPPLFLISSRGFADQPMFGQPLYGLGPYFWAAPVPYFFQGFCCEALLTFYSYDIPTATNFWLLQREWGVL